MATYLFRDENKAAFVNGMNALFSENSLNRSISSSDLIDTPSAGKAEFTLFITDDSQEISILDNAIKTKHFGFPLRQVDLKSMIKESKKLSKASTK
jgi:hypothetical protein